LNIQLVRQTTPPPFPCSSGLFLTFLNFRFVSPKALFAPAALTFFPDLRFLGPSLPKLFFTEVIGWIQSSFFDFFVGVIFLTHIPFVDNFVAPRRSPLSGHLPQWVWYTFFLLAPSFVFFPPFLWAIRFCSRNPCRCHPHPFDPLFHPAPYFSPPPLDLSLSGPQIRIFFCHRLRVLRHPLFLFFFFFFGVPLASAPLPPLL